MKIRIVSTPIGIESRLRNLSIKKLMEISKAMKNADKRRIMVLIFFF
jgi:hypothetical protein